MSYSHSEVQIVLFFFYFFKQLLLVTMLTAFWRHTITALLVDPMAKNPPPEHIPLWKPENPKSLTRNLQWFLRSKCSSLLSRRKHTVCSASMRPTEQCMNHVIFMALF